MDASAVMRALAAGTERKSFTLELKDIDETGRFRGLAAVYGNVDLGLDIIDRGAFKKTVEERPVVPILSNHDADGLPLGVGSLSDESEGLAIEGKLTLAVQRAAEVHALMLDGAVKGLSIGYRAVQKSYEGKIRRLKEVAVKEVSVVTFPMNELALIGDVKSAELIGGIADLLRRLRDEDPEAVKALLEELEPGGGPLDDPGAASQESEPDLLHSLQSLTKSMKEITT